MASFVPIIKDLVPLVMPSSIHITRAKDLQPPTDAPGGKVSTSPAISGISGKLSASILHIPAQTSTPICHHGAQDTILYILPASTTAPRNNHINNPHSTITLQTTTPSEKVIRTHLSAGDVILIPAWTEYQLVNESIQTTVRRNKHIGELDSDSDNDNETGYGIVTMRDNEAASNEETVSIEAGGLVGHDGTVNDGNMSNNAGTTTGCDGIVSVMITGSGREIGSVELKGWGGGTV